MSQNRLAVYIHQHWHGLLPLWQSFWINGILFTLGYTAFLLLASKFVDISVFPRLGAVVVILNWLMLTILYFWQIVGIWRSACSRGFFDYLARFFTITIVIIYISALILIAWPQSKEMAYIAIGRDPLGSFTISSLNDGLIIKFEGEFIFGAADSLEDFIEEIQHKGNTPKLLLLNSAGGRIKETRKIRDIIIKNNFSTYVEKQCFSACVLVFAAGANRIISTSTEIGLHQYSATATKPGDLKAEYNADKIYLNRQGIDANLLERAYSVPNDQLWYPTREQLLTSNLATRLVFDQFMALAISIDTVDQQKFWYQKLSKNPLIEAYTAANEQKINELAADIISEMNIAHGLYDYREYVLSQVIKATKNKFNIIPNALMIDYAALDVEIIKQGVSKDYLYCARDSRQRLSLIPKDLFDLKWDILTKIWSVRQSENINIQSMPLHSEVTDYIQSLPEQQQRIFFNGSGDIDAQHCAIYIDIFTQIASFPEEKRAAILRKLYANQYH